MTRLGTWPPGPVYRSLVGTLLVLYPLAVGLSLLVGEWTDIESPVGSIQSIIWRLGFVFALLWVELHRQSMRMFLGNLGVSRWRTLASIGLVYGVLEFALLFVTAWARTA